MHSREVLKLDLKEYFILCEKQIPLKSTSLRRISLALRRSGITKMEDLYETMDKTPYQILDLRGIGIKSIDVIKEVCSLYVKE